MHTFTERGCDCPFSREEWELIDSLPETEMVTVVFGSEYEVSGQYISHQKPREMTVHELRAKFRWARPPAYPPED